MTAKSLKGQFFTTNSDYILSGFEQYIKGKEITDPFAGNQDLMNWAKNKNTKSIKGFDIDDNYVNGNVKQNDSINHPKIYKFVLTNPPYLHKNKATKEVKQKYFQGKNAKFEDLYQISINSIMQSEEGIVIVPLNFLSARNSERIRQIFFNKFKITALNIFLEQVFDDTTYNVISFYYKKRFKHSSQNVIDATIFPSKKNLALTLKEKYDWQLGGDFFAKINSAKNFLRIYRFTEKHLKPGNKVVRLAHNNIKHCNVYNIDEELESVLNKNIIFLRAIDSKNGKKIQLEDIRQYGVKGLIGKASSRNMAYLLFEENIDIKLQEKLIKMFNQELSQAREKHSSLFLTNFRDNNRKRINFDFAYKFINYLYLNKCTYTAKQPILF